MRQFIKTTPFIFLLGILFACNNQPQAPVAAKEVTVGTLNFNKSEGSDCNKPDSLRTNCAEITLSWPNLESGSDALKNSVAAWANTFVVSLLSPEADAATAATVKVEAAAQNFFKSRAEFAKEAPDSPLGLWVAESKSTTLLNDGKHLTLELTGYSFTGGAHGNPVASVATFDNTTGKQLTWDDLVTDKAALQTLAEKKFRTERADIFKEGFDFDETFKFALPANYGLTKDGIYFHYLHYEVGPYAIGNTTFTLPFAEIGAIAKK